MATIDQARADRARENLNRQIERQEVAQQDMNRDVARADVARTAFKGDGVEGKNSSTKVIGDQAATADGGIVHTATGENPFGTLAGKAEGVTGAEQFILAEALPLGTELAPEVEQMVKLAAFQLSGLKQGAAGMQASASKVRLGTMLLLSDDSEAAGEQLGDLRSNADALAGTINETASTDEKVVGKIISEHVMTSQFPAGMDVNAYVEAVLREAYMLQQGVLEDYAKQMDQINTTRKAMRDRLSRLNALKSKASTGSASVNDLEDLGVTLEPGEVDNLGGDDFKWDKQIQLEEAEDELNQLEGKPQIHQADIEAAHESQEKDDTHTGVIDRNVTVGAQMAQQVAQKREMSASGTDTKSEILARLASSAAGQSAAPGTHASAPATPGSAGSGLPADAHNSPQAQKIAAAQAKVDELMKEKVDALAADPQHADEVKTFLSGKVDAAIETQKGDLDGANGDAEMMQLQLQDAMQKSQELMQMMSNMSKVLHDTVMAVVRNIGG